ncbi:LAME_0E00430g1_1 [Lachancea meyersii CBS 8951]|uniref:LAME_0E00430g1_1 n=1 Tax=Lachancea meyersii CBS 8951 TaxID=1266667 RepID=A0A1G4JF24_9SACH|nr:LAME_0E00430g1_1 [Lachancea meyersii CBS 8951]
MSRLNTEMVETELLEDFLFTGAGNDSTGYALDDEPGKHPEDDLFTSFINTEMLQQAPSNYTINSQHQAMSSTSSLVPPLATPNLLDGFSGTEGRRHLEKSVSPLDPLSMAGSKDVQHNARAVYDANVSDAASEQQPRSYSQGCERLVDHTLQFGRTKPIQSAYLNPNDFLSITEDSLPYKLTVSGMPSTSRVETQIKLELVISPPPREYVVHLPTDCITKQKWYLENDISAYPKQIQNEMLYLESFLVCASNGKPTYVCSRCVKREQRRASRRKSGLCDNMLWCNNENRRAVVFNSRQVFSIKDHNCNSQFKMFDLSARIVCYCRHHKEPEGFKILFVLRNARQEVLAKSVTGPIMIMDKKSNKDSSGTVSRQESAVDLNNITDGSRSERSEIPHVTSTSDLSGLENYKPGDDFMHLAARGENMLSPTSMGGDSSEAHITDANTADHPIFRSVPGYSTSRLDSAQANKRKRTSDEFVTSSLYNQDFAKPLTVLNFSKSLSTSSSSHSIPQALQDTNPSSSLMTATNSMLRGISDITDQAQNIRPFIQRVIPAQGPVKGGIEITLLGSNFKPGMIVKFGENKALSTQCWSESTLVTYLPPSSKAGEVLVTVFEKEEQDEELLGTMSTSKTIFTYVDDTDRQLIELALQIVGLKMNGKLEDARNIAKRIVGHDSGSANNSPGGSTGNVPQNQYNMGPGPVLFSDESLLLRVIKLLNSSSNLSMCDEEGQTMLHLACLKGYYQLAAALVRKGARVDAKDSFGFSPLHFACLNGDGKIIRLLVQCKAAIQVEAMNGSTPRDLFIANHDTDDERYEDYLNEVLDALDIDISSEELSTTMGRKMSDSSFQSSVFDAGSLASLNDNLQVHISKMREDRLSDDDEDFEDYEEDGDEGLLGDDEESTRTDDANSTPRELSPLTAAGGLGGLSRERLLNPHVRHDPASVSTTNINDNDNNDNNNNHDSNDKDNNNNNDSSNRNSTENSIWNRMLSALNDELPTYDDLFPSPGREKQMRVLQSTPEPGEQLSAISSSAVEDSQASSEDEEDALQARLNRFFQQRQNFQNDKMLLFFWLPLTIILLSSFLIYEFGHDGNTVHYWSEAVSEYLRVGLAKVMLGNQRVKGAFKGSLHSLQAGIIESTS